MRNLPDSVVMGECWARDGLQSEPNVVPTGAKVEMIRGMVEAGFTPLEAIKIASFNGAKFLGEDARIGSIAPGKQADLMVVKGNPAANILDIEKVEIVFKDGVGYDSEKLIQSVQGLVGIR